MTTYVVKPGDSLSIIARDQLGDVSRWAEIAALNKLSPTVPGGLLFLIYPGQVLNLPDPPAAASSSAPAPKPSTDSKGTMIMLGLAALFLLGTVVVVAGGKKKKEAK